MKNKKDKDWNQIVKGFYFGIGIASVYAIIKVIEFLSLVVAYLLR